LMWMHKGKLKKQFDRWVSAHELHILRANVRVISCCLFEYIQFLDLVPFESVILLWVDYSVRCKWQGYPINQSVKNRSVECSSRRQVHFLHCCWQTGLRFKIFLT
jgi:hypothetical protein